VSNQGYQVVATFHGAEVDDVRRIARDIERNVTEISQLVRDILGAYKEAQWTGADSDDFARQFSEFNGLMLRRTRAMGEACRDLRQAATRQEKTSK